MATPPYRRILLAYDGSDGAITALDAAIDLAKEHRVRLSLIAVDECRSTGGAGRETSNESGHLVRKLEHARARARIKGVECHAHMATGPAVDAIVKFVHAENIDLLAIGFRHHSRFDEAIRGTTAERLIHLSPSPVLLAK